MGNQQERSLSWLAGILDGEGTISAQVYTLPDGRVRITPFFCIVNSDVGILSESKRILDQLCEGQKFSKARICNHGGTHKPTTVIRIDGTGSRKPLEALRPYLRSSQKTKAADAVLEYFKLRDARMIKRDHLGRILRQGYTREEIELLCSIRSHSKAKSSEAICSAPNVIG